MECDKVFRRLLKLEKYARMNEGCGNRNSGSGVRIATALYRKNRLVALGKNSMKTVPLQVQMGVGPFFRYGVVDVDNPIYVHGEIDVINKVLRMHGYDFLKKCELYIVRIKKSEEKPRRFIWGISKPCNICLSAIYEFGIPSVYYTLDEDKEGRKTYECIRF